MPRFNGMTVALADEYRAGKLDTYGNAPERKQSDGAAPCRCCLKIIPDGMTMLVLAFRPFEGLHPYAETGPIFLCADECRPKSGHDLPMMLVSPEYLLKGYSADERIVYGTGQITTVEEVSQYADELLAKPHIAFVDLRSAKNNCWQARLTRQG